MGFFSSLDDYFTSPRRRQYDQDAEIKAMAIAKAKAEAEARAKLLPGVADANGVTYRPPVMQSGPTQGTIAGDTFNTSPMVPGQGPTSAPPLMGMGADELKRRGLLGDLSQFNQYQQGLTNQADPDAAMMQKRLEPITAQMAPDQRTAFQIDPVKSADAYTKNAFQQQPDSLRVIDGLKAKIAQFGAGTPEGKPYEDALDKLNYIKEKDPLFIKETNAAIDEKRSSAAKNAAQTDLIKEGGIDEDTMGRMYDQLMAGQPMSAITGNLGRGQQGATNLTKFNNFVTAKMKSQGYTGADIAKKNAEFSAIRSGMIVNEKASANIDRAAKEMDILADQLTDASKNVDRVGWTDLNQLTNFAKSHTSNPEYGKLDVAVQGFKTAFGQALARNGIATDAVRAKSDALFSGVRNHADLMARVAQAKLEAKGVIQATGETAKALSDRIGPPDAAATPPVAKIPKWNPASGSFE